MTAQSNASINSPSGLVITEFPIQRIAYTRSVRPVLREKTPIDRTVDVSRGSLSR